MIRVTIELLKKGNPNERVHKGTIEIANDKTGSDTMGNYIAKLTQAGKSVSIWKFATVWHFPRKRLGAYDLLFRILYKAVGSRNKDWIDNNPL